MPQTITTVFSFLVMYISILCWMWPAVLFCHILQGVVLTFVANVWESCRHKCRCLHSTEMLGKAPIIAWILTQKYASSQTHICLEYILSTFQEVQFLCLHKMLLSLDTNLPVGMVLVVLFVFCFIVVCEAWQHITWCYSLFLLLFFATNRTSCR